MMESLVGKTVKVVTRGRCGEFLLVEFDDGTTWLVTPERENAADACLQERVSWPHNGYKSDNWKEQ